MSNKLYKEFVNWLERINQSEEISADLSAFYFGIFETEKEFVVQLSGAKTYLPDDEDWSCEQDFVPAEKYFELDNNLPKKDWQEVLQIAVDLLNEFIKSENFSQSFLAQAKAVAVGFHGGDLIKVKY